jgi:hypothetical protein
VYHLQEEHTASSYKPFATAKLLKPNPQFYTESLRDNSKAEKFDFQCTGQEEIKQNNGRFPFICIPGHGCGVGQSAAPSS